MTTSTVPHVPPARQAPGRGRYLLALLVFIAGMLGMAGVLVYGLSGMGDGLFQVVVPGEQHLTLEPGSYTIFHERHSVFNGRVYDTQALGGLELAVVGPDGQEVALAPVSMTGQYTFGGRSGVSVFDFTVDKGGDYVVSGRYPDSSGPDTVIAIGQGFLGNLLGTIFGGLAFAFGGAGIALFVFLTTLFRRRRAGHSF